MGWDGLGEFCVFARSSYGKLVTVQISDLAELSMKRDQGCSYIKTGDRCSIVPLEHSHDRGGSGMVMLEKVSSPGLAQGTRAGWSGFVGSAKDLALQVHSRIGTYGIAVVC